jgi:hypothetical protein
VGQTFVTVRLDAATLQFLQQYLDECALSGRTVYEFPQWEQFFFMPELYHMALDKAKPERLIDQCEEAQVIIRPTGKRSPKPSKMRPGGVAFGAAMNMILRAGTH